MFVYFCSIIFGQTSYNATWPECTGSANLITARLRSKEYLYVLLLLLLLLLLFTAVEFSLGGRCIINVVADEHRMIYSFSNTTSYCTFYAFFSSFRITLWPMCLANSKRQPFFLSTIVTRTRRHTELTKKLTNVMGNLCCAREHSVQFFVQFFIYTVKLHSLT